MFVLKFEWFKKKLGKLIWDGVVQVYQELLFIIKMVILLLQRQIQHYFLVVIPKITIIY
uniref:Uncharacterized protein n=1 Tax=viral metagenome TaxID=1070528 RepID=A0A6C0AF31_9ZZZZ